jgi:hypothetical protein
MKNNMTAHPRVRGFHHREQQTNTRGQHENGRRTVFVIKVSLPEAPDDRQLV